MGLRASFAVSVLVLATFALARDRERTYDLKHVDWSVSFDVTKGAIFGDVTNTLAPLKEVENLDFDCGKLTVRRVTVDNGPARFEIKGEVLTVHLSAPARSGVDISVRIVYHGTPQAGVYFIPAARAFPSSTGMVYTQGEAEDTRYWLPTYDFPNDKATTSAHITVKPGEYALSNGRLEGIDKTDSSWTYNWRMRQPHSTYLVSFIVGEYATGHEDWNGLDVFWAVPKGLEEMGKASFEGTADMVRFFGDLTGLKYPYDKFSQAVVSDFMFGGMENVTMVTNTIGTLHSPLEKPVADSQGLVLHELAHQWFGDTVTCRDWSHIWLNEGWASFLPHFYTRFKHGQDAYDIGRWNTLQGAFGAARGASRPMVSDDYEIPMDMFDGNAYGGGAARMFLLMDLLGEEAFWKGVAMYLDTYKFGNVTTEQFFQVMSQVSGRDLEQFKKQWFYAAGAPQLTARLEGSVLTVTQEPQGFVLEVPVGVLKNGLWTMHSVSLSGSSRADLGDTLGAAVVIDPACTLMVGYAEEPSLTAQQVVEVLNSAPNAATKMRMMGRMFDWSSDERAAVYDSETSVEVRLVLMSLFGKSDAAFLVRESRSGDPRVAASAIQQLALAASDEAAQHRLREVFESHPNPRLRAIAVRALSFALQDSGLADLAWNMPSNDEGFRKAALDYWAQSDKPKARRVCLQQLTHPLNEQVRVAAIRHLGALKDEEGSHEVYDALLRVLEERSFGALNAAVSALGQYGNPAALESLRPFTGHSLFTIRRSANAAISVLSKV